MKNLNKLLKILSIFALLFALALSFSCEQLIEAFSGDPEALNWNGDLSGGNSQNGENSSGNGGGTNHSGSNSGGDSTSSTTDGSEGNTPTTSTPDDGEHDTDEPPSDPSDPSNTTPSSNPTNPTNTSDPSNTTTPSNPSDDDDYINELNEALNDFDNIQNNWDVTGDPQIIDLTEDIGGNHSAIQLNPGDILGKSVSLDRAAELAFECQSNLPNGEEFSCKVDGTDVITITGDGRPWVKMSTALSAGSHSFSFTPGNIGNVQLRNISFDYIE